MSPCEAALCGTIIKRVSYQALSVVAQWLPPSELPVDVGALSSFPPSPRPAVLPTLIFHLVYFAIHSSPFHSLWVCLQVRLYRGCLPDVSFSTVAMNLFSL